MDMGSRYFQPRFTNLSTLILGRDTHARNAIKTSIIVFINRYINPKSELAGPLYAPRYKIETKNEPR